MKALEKLIKDALAGHNYKSGIKQVSHSVKGATLVIVSKSIASAVKEDLQLKVKAANAAFYEYPGTSVQLGKLCNKPFRISAIAITSGTAAEIGAIMSEKEAAPK
jgi:large subunit ribosomal protein L30e